MKKIMLIAMTFIIHNLSIAGGVPPMPKPESAFVERDPDAWDWTSPHAFNELTAAAGNRGITTPWNYADHFGLNISGNIPLHSQGWRLVSKKFICTDYELLVACPIPERIPNNFPHFVIYNVYTGVFRVFVYIDEDNFTSADTLYVNYNISETGYAVGESNIDTGWMVNNLDIAKALEDKAASDNSGHEIFTEFHDKDWLVIDIPFSYANPPRKPNLDNPIFGRAVYPTMPEVPDNLAIRISLYGISNTELTANGDLTFLRNGVPIGRGQASGKSTKDILSDAISTYRTNAASLESAKKWLEKTSADLKSGTNYQSFPYSLGTSMEDVSGIISLVGPAFPAATAAGGLISAFSSRGKYGSASIAFDSASLKIKGKLTSNRHIHELSIGIPGSNQYKDLEKTIIDTKATNKIDGYLGHLGLFSVNTKPSLLVTSTATQTDARDVLYFAVPPQVDGMFGGLLINQSLEDIISLKNIRYQIEVRTNSNYVARAAEITCSGMSPESGHLRISQNMALENTVYYKENGDLRSTNSGSEYQYKILGPLIENVQSYEKLALCLHTANLQHISDTLVLMRYYLDFENSVTGDIYSEMRLYPVTFRK